MIVVGERDIYINFARMRPDILYCLDPNLIANFVVQDVASRPYRDKHLMNALRRLRSSFTTPSLCHGDSDKTVATPQSNNEPMGEPQVSDSKASLQDLLRVVHDWIQVLSAVPWIPSPPHLEGKFNSRRLHSHSKQWVPGLSCVCSLITPVGIVSFHTFLCIIIHSYALSYIPMHYHTFLCIIIHSYA
jgi:hypothetical protein